MSESFDVAVLGGGTGGYVAAIRAAQLGLSVAIIEKEKLGGTCLHKGCIPSKALLRSAELYATMKESSEFGIDTEGVSLNFPATHARKNKIVDQLHKGIQHLMKQNKIKVYEGKGRIMGPSIFSPLAGSIAIETPDGEQEIIVPKNVIVATGSRPRSLPGMDVDGTNVINSDHALMLETLPKSLIIVGGGVIGIEWASMFNDFGVEVTVVEYDARILPFEDEEISKEMTRLLKKRKVNIHTNTKVDPTTVSVDGDQVTIKADKGGKIISFTADKVLVSVGRQPNIEGIGLENTEIKVERGSIVVNDQMQTAESHIYAIGDVIGGLQLAHVASHEGIVAAESIAGKNTEAINYSFVPKCTYSRPEIANVGMTEQEAIDKGYTVKTGKFSFRAIGKALVFGEQDGFVKIVSDEKTSDVLGVHMIGPHVTDLISEAGLAMVLNATPWEIAHMIHPHPTLSEIMGEAALAVDGKAIHS